MATAARRAPLDRGVEQAIVALKKGAHLLKCGRRGKPKFCPFRLSTDEKVLIWYSGEKEKQLKLKSVSKIVLGQKTVNFLRHSQPEKESQSFSLIYQNGERSLDLICKDREQAESWFLGLTALLTVSLHSKPLANVRFNRGTRSCAASPATHVRRKYRLGLLEDSPKFSKVHSLNGSPPQSLLERLHSDNQLSSSKTFYTPRHRTLSDMQPVLDEMLLDLPHVVESFRKPKDSDWLKEQRMVFTPRVSSPDNGFTEADTKDCLKDVFIWGEDITRFLGDGIDSGKNVGSKSDALVPILLQSTAVLEASGISCGEKHTALVTKQGEVFCWGEEDGGRLGHKINIDVPYPKVVESLRTTSVQTVSCGTHHTCAVTDDGELYSWGDNYHGVKEHEHGGKRSWWFPQRILGPFDGIHISSVACGAWHTAVISSNGQLFTYGDGTFGVLGHGNTQSVSEPKEVESLKGLRVKCVACGPWHTAAIVEVMTGRSKGNTPGGKLFTWGDGDKGRLGHASKDRKLVPTCVAPLVDCDFVQVSCGRTLTVALTLTGIVFTMGSAVYGQLGNPQARDTSIATVEGCLTTEFVKKISAGSFHVAALTTKGKVYTWGRGENGRLGLGDTRDRNYPTLVEALEDRRVHNVACGSSFTAAVCSHKSISSKDQSVCNRCQMAFGITRKKHNCYHCGLVFCNSCSSRKANNASLAPIKEKKYRVCDPCFAQLEKLVEPRINGQLMSLGKPLMRLKGSLDPVSIRETLFAHSKMFSPKVCSEEGIKLIHEKAAPSQTRIQQCQDAVLPPSFSKTQRWGQVTCPPQFSEQSRTEPSLSVPMAREKTPIANHSDLNTAKIGSLQQDLTEADEILLEELKQLHAEATLLGEQYQAKNLKLCQYKRRITDTWALARDEAAKCKAAKDVIKILTNQMNALSEKLSAGIPKNNVKSIPDDKLHILIPRPLQREVSETIPVTDKILNWKGTRCHQQGAFSFEHAHQRPPKPSRDEWVEQDEPGVYITFVVLPSGQKGLKRVRFSRRKFSDKEAERWWEENQSRVYLKYNVERVVASTKN